MLYKPICPVLHRSKIKVRLFCRCSSILQNNTSLRVILSEQQTLKLRSITSSSSVRPYMVVKYVPSKSHRGDKNDETFLVTYRSTRRILGTWRQTLNNSFVKSEPFNHKRSIFRQRCLTLAWLHAINGSWVDSKDYSLYIHIYGSQPLLLAVNSMSSLRQQSWTLIKKIKQWTDQIKIMSRFTEPMHLIFFFNPINQTVLLWTLWWVCIIILEQLDGQTWDSVTCINVMQLDIFLTSW